MKINPHYLLLWLAGMLLVTNVLGLEKIGGVYFLVIVHLSFLLVAEAVVYLWLAGYKLSRWLLYLHSVRLYSTSRLWMEILSSYPKFSAWGTLNFLIVAAGQLAFAGNIVWGMGARKAYSGITKYVLIYADVEPFHFAHRNGFAGTCRWDRIIVPDAMFR